MSLRNSRLLQLLGLLICIVGLAGFWLTRDVERAELDASTRELLGATQDEKPISFLIAGRDKLYTMVAGDPIYDNRGNVIGRRANAQSNAYGRNTDTILYASIVGNDVSLVAIPRDIWLPEWQTKINSMYGYQGADGLKRSVEEVLGIPIDYYAIINLDIFQGIVDALDGVEVNVPERMYYNDYAGQLFIDLQPGLQTLDGDQAAGFVRYRHTLRGDYDRIDRVKTLAYAMLNRVKELNVRAAGKVPALIQTAFEDIETNASLPVILELLPRLSKLSLNSATLPTTEIVVQLREGSTQALTYDPEEVETFLAETFGGTARDFADVPDATLLITNRSGKVNLETWYKERLVAMGIPEDAIVTREASLDPTPTRVLATTAYWQDADYYTSLLRTSKQQIDHISPVEARDVALELVLGEDAAGLVPVLGSVDFDRTE